MKRTCVQCGKEFEITDSEAAFFKKKGLQIPKRCKECREKNKGNNNKTKNSATAAIPAVAKAAKNHSAGSKNPKNKLVALIAVVVVAVIALGIKLVNGGSPAVNPNEPYTRTAEQHDEHENAENNEYPDVSDTAPAGDNEDDYSQNNGNGNSQSGNNENYTEPAENHSGANTETPGTTSGTSQNGNYDDDNENELRNTTEDEEEPSQAPVIITETPETGNSYQPSYYSKYRFRNQKLLDQHYQKHGKEMGFPSAEAYQKAASDVVENPNALHKHEKEDNDGVYYIKSTGEFVVVSTDGYIRTYYIASLDYFNRQ